MNQLLLSHFQEGPSLHAPYSDEVSEFRELLANVQELPGVYHHAPGVFFFTFSSYFIVGNIIEHGHSSSQHLQITEKAGLSQIRNVDIEEGVADSNSTLVVKVHVFEALPHFYNSSVV